MTTRLRDDRPVPGLVTLADVQAARDLLAGIARDTPLEGSRALAAEAGGPVWLKCENLQRTGSFKIRGAYVRIARLTDAERARGVVAASAGNHAQGVALAASLLGARATVFMPEGAALPKVTATQAYGADVRLVGATIEQSLAAATVFAAETGAAFIHPFDHPDVIAGQGTVGLEIAEHLPDVRSVVVSAGGGGLASGVAVAVKALVPEARVVAAQAAGAATWPLSLAAGRPTPLTAMSTMADGIAVGAPGDVTFAHMQALVDDVVVVSEESLARAVVHCLERAKLVVEPAGAAGVAALMDGLEVVPPVAIVLSGGNVDPLLIDKLIRRGLVAAGRYLSLRVAVPDVPGSLARVLEVLAKTGANVLDVEHLRTQADLALDHVEVALRLETRGPTHCDAVVAALSGAGWEPRSG
ncbi:MAG TPA: threonine ammonia-lyase [Mycobacteriales bacterium]|nr:threonine ammonia-lyase [Mycobacteriales bacterium]